MMTKTAGRLEIASSTSFRARSNAVVDRVQQFLRDWSVPVLRICLGAVFIWFGALKVADATPVGDLVAGTVPWFDRTWFVPALGAVEVLLGVALLVDRFTTIVCAVLVAHLCGTFLVLIMEPGLAFQHDNPVLLTTIGEFVVKNVVLIAAALVIASSRHRPRPEGSGADR
jgi:putative oxidoreductase